MPIPKPTGEETEKEFISRCMGDEVMNSEYPKEEVRAGICYSQWENRNKFGGRTMERKNIKFELKAVDELQGTFEGIASAYRKTPDKVNDIAKPGAFKKTVNEHPEVPTFFMHDIMLPIGKVNLAEGSGGLDVKGQLVRGVQKAEEALLLMKAGVIKTLSIGYDVIQKEFKDGIRYLTEVRVHEVSVVVGDFAADDMAIITSVKASESLDKRMQEISNAYRQSTRPAQLQEVPTDDSWLKEIFNDHVIVSKGDSLWSVPYTEKDGVIAFDFEKATEVEQVYQPKAVEKALAVTEAVKDTSADKEAADILDALKAYNIGFDPQAAEDRVEELLKKL